MLHLALAWVCLGGLALLVRSLEPWVMGSLLLLAAAFVADFLAAPAPTQLKLSRSFPERAGLGQPFQRVLRIENNTRVATWLEVREEFSALLSVASRSVQDSTAAGLTLVPAATGDPTGGPDRVHLPPNSVVELERSYVGSRRGVERLGALRLRLRGPVGLAERQVRLAGEGRVAIRPALLGLSHTLRLAASERWRDLGVRPLRRRGGMTEFDSLRDYVSGDEVRMVDWKAFARRSKPMVREYREEQGQELVLVLDCGRRMAASADTGEKRYWSKLDFALDAALQLAAVALQKGDRVGIFAFDARVRAWQAPARGARTLARLEEAVFDLLPSGLESDYALALRELAVRQRRRATLLIFSDVADPYSVPGQARALRQGMHRHKVIFAALDDPELRLAGELGADVSAAVSATALALLAERKQSLAELSRSCSALFDSLPAESAARALGAWLAARRMER